MAEAFTLHHRNLANSIEINAGEYFHLGLILVMGLPGRLKSRTAPWRDIPVIERLGHELGALSTRMRFNGLQFLRSCSSTPTT